MAADVMRAGLAGLDCPSHGLAVRTCERTAVARLEARDDVVHAESNYLVRSAAAPNSRADIDAPEA
jgi:hypothetical protein